MGKIKGIHHINIRPNKELYPKTVDFYTGILGCEMVRQWDDGPNPGCMVDLGDGSLMEILIGDGTSEPNLGTFEHVAFTVDDVAEMIDTVRENGYKITMEPRKIEICKGYEVEIAFCDGPVGESIEFFKEL